MSFDHRDACLTYERASSMSIFTLVCRTDFAAPGYAVVDCGPSMSSLELRAYILELQSELATLHRYQAARELHFVSAARFDQQESTKLHRDGGPEQSLLILGYEPTTVVAELYLADYARCAHEHTLSPQEFLKAHNPMFAAGEALLRPYITHVPCFTPAHAQVVIINNSCAPYDPAKQVWQGLLHQATILAPDPSARRVINSTMVASLPLGTPSPLAGDLLEEFATTAVVHRRGYDKPHLDE